MMTVYLSCESHDKHGQSKHIYAHFSIILGPLEFKYSINLNFLKDSLSTMQNNYTSLFSIYLNIYLSKSNELFWISPRAQ